MRHTNWRPYVIFSIMIGFMLIIGLSSLFLWFSYSGDVSPQLTPEGWRSGMWGMWGMGRMLMRFLFLGFGIMFLMLLMRLIFGGTGRRDRFWDQNERFWGRSGRMDWTPDQDSCQECRSPIQANWKICPHCGSRIRKEV